MKWAVVLAALAGCSSFEDPDIVVDLRVLGMSATIPEQVVDIDIENPQQPTELLAQLVPSDVCVLLADPAFDRRLRYQFHVCVFGAGSRCDEDVMVPIGSGVIEDPDWTVPAPQMCATVQPNGNLLGVLLETLNEDILAAVGGIEYLVVVTVRGEEQDPSADQYAAKTLRVAPRYPAGRLPNRNPSLTSIEATFRDTGTVVPLDLRRCVEQTAPLEVKAGTTLRLTPIEPEGVREAYSIATLDGKSQVFNESLTYQWVASAGGYSSGGTGGPRDLTGNPAPLFSDWKAPPPRDITAPTDVQLWIVQRDERLGVQWYESCVRVVP